MVIKFFIIVLFLFLSSCFIGPVKELKQQIEDEWDNENIPINPTPLSEKIPTLDHKTIWSNNFKGMIEMNIDFAVCKDSIFIAHNNNKIISIDQNNGESNFELTIDENIAAGISCETDKLFFTTKDGFLWALNNDGSLIWKYFVGQVMSRPLIVDSSIIIKTINHQIISLNKDNGSINWNYQPPNPPLLIKSWGGLVYSDGIVYSGLPAGKILALDFFSGSLIWETTYSQPQGTTSIDRANDTTSTPVIESPFIFIGSSKGNFASIDKETGAIIWQRPLSSFYDASIYDEFLIVPHISGSIYAIFKDSSKIAWRNSDFINRDTKQIKFYKNKIIVGDYDGFIHFVDIHSGKTLYRLSVSDTSIIKYKQINDAILIVDKYASVKLIKVLDDEFQNSYKQQNNIYQEEKADPVIEQEKQTKSENSLIDELFFWE